MKDSIAPDDAGTETRTADVDFFGYRQYPRIVYFGHGCRSRLGEVLAELGCERPAVLLSPSQRDFWEELQRSASLVPVVLVEHDLPHVPIRSRDEVATQAAARDADVLICLGGGSVTGLAKAVATQTGLPYVALPTTYAGSEMTDFFGTSDGGKKQGHQSPRAASRAVLYDPELTCSMPSGLTGSSGVNALAQAIGSLWSPRADPLSRAHAAAGVRRLVAALPHCVERPGDVAARSQALLGAHFCALALGVTGLSPHHELVHALSGLTPLPHAGLHAVLLPHTTAWAVAHVPEVRSALVPELGPDPAATISALLERLALATSLVGLGLAAADWQPVREDLLENVGPDWRPHLGELAGLLDRAYAGASPGAT